MKTIAAFFNNYSNRNTNATTDRTECERNVCRNELYRLQYGLWNLLEHNGVEIRNKTRVDRYSSCCRRWNRYRNDDDTYNYDSSVRLSHVDYDGTRRDLRQNIQDPRTANASFVPTNKSLLYKILERRLSDCFATNQRIDKNQSDSISITSSSISTDSASFSPHSITSQPSTTDTMLSLESTSISILPSGTPTPIKSKRPSKKNLLDINDYKKSRLTVPNAKTSRPKKSKKQGSSKRKKTKSKSTK